MKYKRSSANPSLAKTLPLRISSNSSEVPVGDPNQFGSQLDLFRREIFKNSMQQQKQEKQLRQQQQSLQFSVPFQQQFRTSHSFDFNRGGGSQGTDSAVANSAVSSAVNSSRPLSSEKNSGYYSGASSNNGGVGREELSSRGRISNAGISAILI